MSIFTSLSAVADPTRSRLLLLLDRHELTVGELCAATRLPQSTVSRHLKVLMDEGWLSVRADGASRFYRLVKRLDEPARELWDAVRAQVAAEVESGADEARAREVLAERRTRSQAFFATAAGQWDSMRRELFGSRAELAALADLLDPEWVVGDLGCGTGQFAETVAPVASRVIAVDESREMLDAARRRLGDVVNVEVREGALESLPIADGTLDAAVMVLVLHHLVDPLRALRDAARVLKPGGRLLVVDMAAHTREQYRERMGHVWLGFPAEQLETWLAEAGFDRVRVRRLPSDADAKGPMLQAASGRKPALVGAGRVRV
ncbi:MAG: ArsR/SmtB family transcription factor [Longimicrobiales bacterium]